MPRTAATLTWRLLALLLLFTAAVAGALAVWSLAAPVPSLPLAPPLLTGLAALVLGTFCALIGWPQDGWQVVLVSLPLMALLWIAALTADFAYTSVHNWDRTPLAVTATLTDCRVDAVHGDGDSGRTEKDSCVYHYTVLGRTHTERHDSPGAEHDGNQLQIWLNPTTGEIGEHSLTNVVLISALALLAATLALLGAWTAARAALGHPEEEAG
ncbi:hypothetical protein CFP65_0864 [Kitasatospora sp. MMS16-BH015]|uniref:hypothetical protein n=1 Tax=Kitasatospora sp. MMS16-BH015 TaxID=2018025 RepID=UPI000CA3BFDE|nr:hypothetical protein [Kitasatospora sp. MMS16-BH015]AUG75791.1 hypothetical protein CFP65_0864 [Kitasatospora sp. MMS16-BH015]